MPDPQRRDSSDLIRVLHVDDDQIQLSQVKLFLETLNPSLKVTSTASPVEALKQIRNDSFDCIVSDFVMPRMDGIEFAQNVREIEDVPLILYTGQGSEEVAEAAFAVGIDDYLRKEIDPSHYKVLVKRIRNAVEKHRTEALYHSVVEETRDALSITVDNNIVYANQAFANLLGFESPKEMIGQNGEKWLAPKDKETIINRAQQLKTGQVKPSLNEFHIKRPNGGIIPVEASTTVIDYNGKTALLTFLRDISVRKKILEERFESEAKFRSLVEMAPEGIVTANMIGTITFVNDAFLELTGFSREEILGTNFTQLGTLRKRDMPKHIKMFSELVRGKVPKPIEILYSKKDGSTGICEIRVSILEFGGKKEVLALARDRTESKKTHIEYQNLFELAPDGIVTLNKDGVITSINPAGLKLADSKEDEVIGKHFSEIINLESDQIPKMTRLFESISKGKKVKPFEVTIYRENSSKIWVEAHPGLIKVSDEDIIIQVILRGITERKLIEESYRLYSKHLEQLVEQRTQELLHGERVITAGIVASIVDHDLRGPLQTIINCTYNMRKGEEENKELLNIIDGTVDLSIGLLDELIQQTKESHLNLTETDLSGLIQRAVMETSVQPNISVSLEIDDKLPSVKLDQLKIRRVLNNLVMNASEAIPDEGVITIKAERDSGDIIIKVIDTGIGMPNNILENLFRPLQTVNEKGIGMGLFYSKRVIESHGGTLSVQTEPGKGTTLTIRLPIELTEYPLLSEPYQQESILMQDSSEPVANDTD